MSGKLYEDVPAAFASMASVEALLKLLTDPAKYQGALDALASHAEGAFEHHAEAEQKLASADAMFKEAKKIADENSKSTAANNEATEKLGTWEADLQRRENLVKIGGEELARNVATREDALKKRENAVVARETAVKREEQRIDQVKVETVARLGLSK